MTKKTKLHYSAYSIIFFLFAAVFTAGFAVPSAAKDGAAPAKKAAPGGGAAQERASPEVGYGEKTPAEIMKEKPRDNKVGLLGDMSGELKEFGEDAAHGAELAADEINAAGGIRGKEFDLIVYDTGGSVAGARDGVETLLKYRAVAIVGAATGEVSFAANKMINENQMPLISAGSRRRLGDTGPYNFRNALNDSDGVGGFVEWISKNRPWKNYALFSSVVNDYSIQLNAVFKSEMMKRKMNITHELFIWSNGMDNILPEERGVVPQLKQMVGKLPDAVVFSGDAEEAASLAQEMRAMGMNIPIIATEDIMVKTFTDLGEKAAGSLVFSGFDVNSKAPKTAAFVKAYTAKYQKRPSRLAALAYDSYGILAQALNKAESLRPSHVRKALMSIKDYDGVTGRTSIGSTREASKAPFIFELRKTGSEWSFVNVAEGK